MKFHTLALVCLVLSANVMAAPGRSPAVEDFVGIEIDEPKTSPADQGSLVNLERDLQELEKIEAKAYVANAVTPKEHVMAQDNQFIQWNVTNLVAWTLLFGLPLLSWFMAVSHLRKKASIENASNIEVLEKYRRERERARKKEEEYRKVS
jgi:hypothetical protein